MFRENISLIGRVFEVSALDFIMLYGLDRFAAEGSEVFIGYHTSLTLPVVICPCCLVSSLAIVLVLALVLSLALVLALAIFLALAIVLVRALALAL